MKLIVAVDENWGIGYCGELLAHVRADLKNFAALTTGHTVILGSKTLSTFPGGRPLKNRTNIILSRRADYAPEGAAVAHSVEELLDIIKTLPEDDCFVIGGASVYELLLPYCNVAYVTKFKKTYTADAYFPDLDADPSWECVSVGKEQISDAATDSEGGLEFCFCEYRRK
ncbi:MAG: dihydrofolate reductase [Clostridia bacterium]|nr:dihydrofolate reductase [Clostridia bacterium]